MDTSTKPAAVAVSPIVLTVNGKQHELELDTRTSLLDVLREHLRLIGTKKGCDHGQCGACTVLANGRRINSCLTLAVMHNDDNIVTIEGLGTPEALHPLQAAFIEHDGFQCGYCTSGQICSAIGMLAEVEVGWPSHVTADVAQKHITLSDAEIRERLSGNICRCGAYPNIVAAIRDVAGGSVRMKPFTYERVVDAREAGAAVLRANAKFISGGTNLLDLMKLEIEQPAHLVDISQLPLNRLEELAETADSASKPRRQTPMSPPIRGSACATGHIRSLARGRLRPAQEQSVDRRQSRATYTLPVFLRYRLSLQQANAG